MNLEDVKHFKLVIYNMGANVFGDYKPSYSATFDRCYNLTFWTDWNESQHFINEFIKIFTFLDIKHLPESQILSAF